MIRDFHKSARLLFHHVTICWWFFLFSFFLFLSCFRRPLNSLSPHFSRPFSPFGQRQLVAVPLYTKCQLSGGLAQTCETMTHTLNDRVLVWIFHDWMLGVLDPQIWLVGIRGNFLFCFFVFPATRLAIHPQSRKAKSIGARHKLTSTLSRRHFLKIWKIPKFKL